MFEGACHAGLAMDSIGEEELKLLRAVEGSVPLRLIMSLFSWTSWTGLGRWTPDFVGDVY